MVRLIIEVLLPVGGMVIENRFGLVGKLVSVWNGVFGKPAGQ